MSTIELRPHPSTAEEWVARMHAADVAERDRAEFYAWVSADPANADAYAQCEALWVVTRQMRSQPALLHESRRTLGSGSNAASRDRKLPRWALAAGVAIIAISVVLLAPRLARDDIQTATRKGEQRVIALEDGSKIQLNTDTIVSYRLTERERRVELHRGEAFFDVARDPARLFVVRAGKSEVQVVGTQFTVRQDGDRLEVVVREGKVNVVPDAATLLPAAATQHVELVPGSSLRLEPKDLRIKVTMVDADRAMAWRSGSVDFDAATLEQVVTELNRYAEKPFRIEDDSIRNIPVTGRVRVNDLESIRYMLRESFQVESISRPDSVALRQLR